MTRYLLNFDKYTAHLARVEITLVAPSDDPVLYLPSWIAGSYMIRDFAKNIANVIYSTNSTSRRADKLAKNQWQLTAKKGEAVDIAYEVYCYDLSVRTAYVDNVRIFGNFSSFLLIPVGHEHTPCAIELQVPRTFFKDKTKIATGLPFIQTDTDTHISYCFDTLPNGSPLDSFESLDFPFEIGEQDKFSFEVTLQGKTIPHHFFVSGVHSCNFERLKADLMTICQSYVDWLGWLPFDEYTFMTYASKDGYGGLEHINSTALMTPRDDLPKNKEPALASSGYRQFLGLCSHEYFHSWWVKSVRPDVMMTSLLDSEAYTPLLWVFEGFTSYMDDLQLLRSGVIDKAGYLDLLAGQISRYQNTEGRHHQTVAESSFDTWIKLYRPDENSPNSTISYYNKGALVALGLDLLLIKHGKRIFDVITYFVGLAKSAPNARFGMSVDNLNQAMEQFLPRQTWQDFEHRYINGVDELPLDEWLSEAGVLLSITYADEPFGASVEETALGLVIKRLNPNSPLAAAGISVNDTLIAINHLKADKKALQAVQNTRATFHVFRRDVLMVFEVQAGQIFTHSKAKLALTCNSPWLAF